MSICQQGLSQFAKKPPPPGRKIGKYQNCIEARPTPLSGPVRTFTSHEPWTKDAATCMSLATPLWSNREPYRVVATSDRQGRLVPFFSRRWRGCVCTVKCQRMQILPSRHTLVSIFLPLAHLPTDPSPPTHLVSLDEAPQ